MLHPKRMHGHARAAHDSLSTYKHFQINTLHSVVNMTLITLVCVSMNLELIDTDKLMYNT